LKLIHELFQKQVEKSPDAPAVLCDNKSFSYQELNHKANRVANFLLVNITLSKNQIIGILFERSFEMIYSIFAVEKARCGYLPLNPSDPAERIQYILKDSQIKVLLTVSKFTDKIADFDGTVICLDRMDLEEKVTNPVIEYQKNDIAYVIYTSGTTGKPKGVVIEHEALLNRILWMNKEYPIGEHDVILQKTPYTFDVSVWEIFWWSITGAAVSMLQPEGHKNVLSIVDNIENNKVTVIHFVPSMLNIFLEYIYYEQMIALDKISTLKYTFCSGEALLPHHVNDFNSTVYRKNGTRLINLYGPTEAAIDVAYYECTDSEKKECVPIGKEIDNIKIMILDQDNELCLDEVKGELCISGVGLARGYLNREDLTNEKFTTLKLDSDETRIYHTGDIALRKKDGNILYMGRMDAMVKIRGNRVELGEVEAALFKCKGVKDAVVVLADGKNEEQYLCAFILLSYENSITVIEKINQNLKQQLPEYMLPRKILTISEMPVNQHGKVDREQLVRKLSCEDKTGRKKINVELDVDYESIVSILESKTNLLKDVESITLEDSLEELGVDSLSFLRIIIALEQKFHIHFDLDNLDVMQFYYLKDLYHFVKEKKEE